LALMTNYTFSRKDRYILEETKAGLEGKLDSGYGLLVWGFRLVIKCGFYVLIFSR